MKSSLPSRHCIKCGELLTKVQVPCRVKEYEPDGTPIYEMKVACPNMKWWNFHDVWWLQTTSSGEWRLHSKYND